jgi:hypothetical protein
MTDFETRARRAGQAARDAVSPVAETSEPRAPQRRRPVLVAVAAALVVVLAAGGLAAITRRGESIDPTDADGFCALATEASDASLSAEEQAALQRRALAAAPEEIRDAATRLAESTLDESIPDPKASAEMSAWYGVHCFPDAAQPDAEPSNRRYAPVDARGFDTCLALNTPLTARTDAQDYGSITIFGDTRGGDPYQRPMVAIATSKEETFGDDGSSRPLAVPGHQNATLSPMTGPFGAELVGEGQVIAWGEQGQNVGVFGRGFGPDRTQELVAIAADVAVHDGRAMLTTDAPPEGYREVYDGPLADVWPPFTISQSTNATFAVAANAALTTLTGSVASDATFNAVRFFAAGLEATTVRGKRALAGQLWADQTEIEVPMLVTWQDGDVTLSLVTYPRAEIQLSMPELHRIAERTRLLNRDEWEMLIKRGDGCEPPTSAGSSDPTTASTTTTVPVP